MRTRTFHAVSRALSLLLVLALAVGMIPAWVLPVSAAAEDEPEYGVGVGTLIFPNDGSTAEVRVEAKTKHIHAEMAGGGWTAVPDYNYKTDISMSIGGNEVQFASCVMTCKIGDTHVVADNSGALVMKGVGTTTLTITVTEIPSWLTGNKANQLSAPIEITIPITIREPGTPIVPLHFVKLAVPHTMYVGQSVQVEAAAYADNGESYPYAYAYALTGGSDTATLSQDGLLSATDAGSVTVKASASLDGNVVAEKEVTLEVKCPRVTVSGKKAMLSGTAQKLEALVDAPEGSVVTWISGDPKVASVDENGNVTAAALGNATITATLTVGDETYTDSFHIAVVSSFTVEQGALTLDAFTIERGDELDLSGVELVLTYNDGSVRTVTNAELTFDRSQVKDEVGKYAASVHYAQDGYTFDGEIAVEVVEPAPNKIIVHSLPTLYVAGEAPELGYDLRLDGVEAALPGDAALSWSFTSPDGAAVETNGGRIQGLKNGTGLLTATVKLADGTEFSSKAVPVTVELPTLVLPGQETGIDVIKSGANGTSQRKVESSVFFGAQQYQGEYKVGYQFLETIPWNLSVDGEGIVKASGNSYAPSGRYHLRVTLEEVGGQNVEELGISEIITVDLEDIAVVYAKLNVYDIYAAPGPVVPEMQNVWDAFMAAKFVMDIRMNDGTEFHPTWNGGDQGNFTYDFDEAVSLADETITLKGHYNENGIYVADIEYHPGDANYSHLYIEDQVWIHIGDFSGHGGVVMEDENTTFYLETDPLNPNHKYLLVAKTENGNFALKQTDDPLGKAEKLAVTIDTDEKGEFVELPKPMVSHTAWLFDGLSYENPGQGCTTLTASNFRSYMGIDGEDDVIGASIQEICFFAVDEAAGRYHVILDLEPDGTTPDEYLAFDPAAGKWIISEEPYDVYLYHNKPNIVDKPLDFWVTPEEMILSIDEERPATPHVLVDEIEIDGSKYTVVWSSRDETIATVDEFGNITGVKKGKTTIEARLTDVNGSQVFDVTNSTPYLIDTVEVTVVDVEAVELPEATVVADFGKPMEIDALEGIAGCYNGYTASIAGFSGAGSSGFADPESLAPSMGSFTALDGKVVFTPKDILTDLERVFVGVRFTSDTDDTDAFCLTMPLTVIPANIVYYETDKVALTTTGPWEAVGDPSGSFQDSGLKANDRYGYDSSYTGGSAYSGGSSLFVTGVKGSNPTATFTFTGTGFDIISLTNPDQGVIAVDVYKGEAQVKGILLLNKGVSQLFQIPVVSEDLGEWGEYTVKISVLPGRPSPASMANKGEFYFDAIRIHGTMAGGENQEIAENAYRADGEGSASFHEIRDTLLSVSEFISSMGGIATGSVYVDAQVNQDAGQAPSQGENTSLVSDYSAVGPKNEVYLKKDQGVAFLVCSESLPGSFDIGAKSADGKPVNLTAYVIPYGNTANATATLDREMATATTMFYDLLDGKTVSDYFTQTEVGGKSGCYAYVVVTNKGENILSLTDIKFGYGGSDPQAVAFYADGTAASLASELIAVDQPDDKGELIAAEDGNYYYRVDGKVSAAYTGLIVYRSMLVYVEKGMVNFHKTGVVSYKGQKYFVRDGLGTVYTGLTEAGGRLLYMEEGVYNAKFTGLAKWMNTWYYVENGVVNTAFSGVYEGWTVENGLVDLTNK